MGLFDKIKEPIFLKEGSELQNQLKALEELRDQADGDLKKRIERDIVAVKAGIAGENNIIYELKNSHYPMYVLHDVTLVHGDLKAQIDFLVITRALTFVIECKNLYGDITVDNNGQFVRKMNYGGYYQKEAIYSPIEQNRKHLDLIKQVTLDSNGAIGKALVNRMFDKWYRGIVVLANAKGVVNDRFATKEVKKQLIRADQLIEYIKKANQEPGIEDDGEKQMTRMTEMWLAKNAENPVDYTEKYKKELSEKQSQAENGVTKQVVTQSASGEPTCPRCGSPMVKRQAKRGINAGGWFYGCSKYPACNGIISSEQYEKMFGQ